MVLYLHRPFGYVDPHERCGCHTEQPRTFRPVQPDAFAPSLQERAAEYEDRLAAEQTPEPPPRLA
jgi:hypothetical protein